jgi:hypothetical protein
VTQAVVHERPLCEQRYELAFRKRAAFERSVEGCKGRQEVELGRQRARAVEVRMCACAGRREADQKRQQTAHEVKGAHHGDSQT